MRPARLIALVALAATMAAASGGSALAKRNTARNVAIGVGAAIVTGIIINEAIKQDQRSRSSVTVKRPSCGTLLRRCQNGNDRSCDQYEEWCDAN